MEVLLRKQVIIRPLLTEKSLVAYRANKVCTFSVNTKSTKADILKNFKDLFGIEAQSIKTVVSRSERRIKTSSRNNVKRKAVKKAYIGIGENTLDIFENIK